MRYRFRLFSWAVCLFTIIAIGKVFSQANFWQQVFGSYDVRALAINNNNHVFAGTIDNGILRSTDDGANWTPVNSGLPHLSVWALTVNSTDYIFAGIPGFGVFLSTDNGANWTAVNTGLTGLEVWALAINSSDHIFAGTTFGGFRSTDNGANWALIGPIDDIYSLAINFDGPPPLIGHIFVGSEGGGIYRSTDNGTNWTPVNNGLTRWYVPALAINSNGHIFGGTTAGSDQGVVRSTDNGENWSPVLTGPPIAALAINSSDHIFAGTPFFGVFLSTDNGANWDSLNSGLTNLTVWSLAINSHGYIFAGTGGSGIFRSMQPTTSIQEIPGRMPGSYALAQNYPNPFNPSTSIEFSLPTAAEVSLVIYNVTGQEVERLIDRRSMAPGQYSVEWAPRALPSGIYFYRIEAGEFRETKRMLLVK